MTWIETVDPDRAEGRLAGLYRRVAGADGRIDNILKAHSLRPHSLEGHMGLYKNVLHHSGNALPKWLLEALGVFTSTLNACEYCVAHHREGMGRALGDPQRAADLGEALQSGRLEDVLDGPTSTLFAYARQLTLDPAGVTLALLDQMRAAGWNDGEILEVNQVVAYFCYANRTVLGLGVAIDGEPLGTSPAGADEEWGHR